MVPHKLLPVLISPLKTASLLAMYLCEYHTTPTYVMNVFIQGTLTLHLNLVCNIVYIMNESTIV